MTTTMTPQDVLIRVQPTPNPSAWKFVLNVSVLNEGKATYLAPEDATQNPLASALFKIESVRQVHLFQNVITITHYFDADIEKLHKTICETIQQQMPSHNPAQTIADEKKQSRSHLPVDVQKIEEILDRTIRPGLQGDGGDLTVVRYEDKKLYVHYEGACGTCPSSTTGTLMAIEGIIRDEFDPSVEVIPI